MDTTILYLTDNSLDESIARACQRVLQREADGIRIVSVSQEPMSFGDNICVGNIGRSWYSLYTQILAGLNDIDTELVAIAEHDCMYTNSFLAFQPPDTSVFWYNRNCWLVQWKSNHPELDGMYSYWPRRLALSQLVCSKALLNSAVTEIMMLLDMGLKIDKGLRWYGEPGVLDTKLRKAFLLASSGRPAHLQDYLKEYMARYDFKTFNAKYSNLDIRHKGNFTGPKRGKKRCYELPYWGRFKDVMNA